MEKQHRVHGTDLMEVDTKNRRRIGEYADKPKHPS